MAGISGMMWGPGSPGAKVVNPEASYERKERWTKILPYINEFKDGRIPENMSVIQLQEYVSIMKSEGNDCFKDKDYTKAYELYSAALNICRSLQVSHYKDIDKELLSNLFSNRAACLLKMDYYRECIQDCEYALQQNANNAKAYFRRASAYKSMKDWLNAERYGLEGLEYTISKNKPKEAESFEELLREVRCHITPTPITISASSLSSTKPTAPIASTLAPQSSSSATTTAIIDKTKNKKTGATAATAATTGTKKSGTSSESSVKEVKAEVSVEAAKKKGGGGVAGGGGGEGGGNKKKVKDVDSSWLEGTNVSKVAPKKVEPPQTKKAKKKARQKAAAASQYHGRFAALGDGDESSSSHSGDSENLDEEEDELIQVGQSASRKMSDGSQPRSVHSVSSVDGMGLDDFGDGVPLASADFKSGSKKTWTQPSSSSRLWSDQLDELDAHNTAYRSASNHSMQSAAAIEYSGDFEVIESSRPLVYPFDVVYDFTLVCNGCYIQTGRGHSGYKAFGHLPHECRRDVLLVRTKDNASARWAKIRPRNLKIPYVSHYKVCREFSADISCRVRESDCSYAHYDEEAHFWALDRDKKFIISDFISQMRMHLQNGTLYFASTRNKSAPSSLNRPSSNATTTGQHRQQELEQQQKLRQQEKQQLQQLQLLQEQKKHELIQQYKQEQEKRKQEQDLNQEQFSVNRANTPVFSASNPNIPAAMNSTNPLPPLFTSAPFHLPAGGDGIRQPPDYMYTRPPRTVFDQFSRFSPMIDPLGPRVPPEMHKRPDWEPLSRVSLGEQYPRPPPQGVIGGGGRAPGGEIFGGGHDAFSRQAMFDPYNRHFLEANRVQQANNFSPLGSYIAPHPDAENDGMMSHDKRNGTSLLYGLSNLIHSGGPNVYLPPRFLNQQPPVYGSTGTQFPLGSTHTYRLVCDVCFTPHAEIYGRYTLNTAVRHTCAESTLAVQRNGEGTWFKIRERKGHRNFLGNYRLCRALASPVPVECGHGEACLFAHCSEEQLLWTREKDNVFNLAGFIQSARSEVSSPMYTVEALLNKYPGEMRFLCGRCYNDEQRLSPQGDDTSKCALGDHDWEESKLLIHYSAGHRVTTIGRRVFIHKTAFFNLCHHQHYCQRRPLGLCSFAHSLIERDVWYTERDLDITQEELVVQAAALNAQKYQQIQQQPPRPSSASSDSPASSTRPNSVNSLSTEPSTTPPQPVNPLANLKCPYNVLELCGLCWQKGAQGTAVANKDRCNGPGLGHIWAQNKICIVFPGRKKVAPLPKRIPQNLNFITCKHVREKKKCDFSLGGHCQFAHSDDEINVWKWMVKNNVQTLDELVAICRKSTEAPTVTSKPIARGQSVVAMRPLNLPTPNPHPSPLDLALNAHYCHYCTIHCNSQKQWDEHCASEKHMFNVNSDKEHQWNYRQPPWGIQGSNYELCIEHMEGGKCRFSGLPDIYNQCKAAHSREELDEWKERWEWRQMKREMAKKDHLYSYMDGLREEFETNASGITVISDSIDGVKIVCPSNLQVYEQSKDAMTAWIFDIRVTNHQPLVKVALLYDRDRLHFSLTHDDLDRGCQYAQGDVFLQGNPTDLGSELRYQVKVTFIGGIYGSFTQWIIFDFGRRPVLVRKVSVELGSRVVHEKVKTLREQLHFDRWTSDNRQIVWFDCHQTTMMDVTDRTSQMNNELLLKYKAPTSADAVITQQAIGVELNRHNYKHKMHKMLNIEELTQCHIMSRYNLQTEIELMEKITEGAILVARPGELFARVTLNEQLNEDTDAGRLILSGVTTVLIAPMSRSQQTVYEAVFVLKENFDFSAGRGSDYIYLCLSARELSLVSGVVTEVEMQFQLNRLHFCQMHYAIDQLENTDIVFPDINKISQTLSDKQTQLELSSSVLNDCQLKIVEFIAAQIPGYKPPLIIYGPFGTGKTETLAQAAMLLATRLSDIRILICTHSNSAADIYILRHLDTFVSDYCPDLKVLRVYSAERRTNTVSPIVQNYCLMTSDRSSFVTPTREDIFRHHIVITTLVTSLVLTKLDLRGCFSHIFVDEAAQVHECQTIMPLCLASDTTSVVLAGDHHQLGHKVFSLEAKRQKFHLSLVERLFIHYQTYAHVATKFLPNILLSINYRTKMEILRFIAAVFYGGPDVLISNSDQPDVPGIIPLTFYAAQGCEIQDSDSTSYYNIAEIEEVVERVYELYTNWPPQWEERNAESILVVTPYLDQVLRIRSALRKKHRDLKTVAVDRVSNVPGTEYRAVFLSTVRTRHLAEDTPHVPTNTSECDGDFGDFGFLSDQKLLNTALTRARSMVAVVGDPVALCAIGESMSIWRVFLKHCQNMKSIHPTTMTLDTIRSQVQNLMNSPYGRNLQILSSLQLQAPSRPALTSPEHLKTTRREEGKNEEEDDEDSYKEEEENEDDNEEEDFADMKPDPNPFESELTVKGVFEDWGLDYQIEPDSIIQQLTREASKRELQSNQKGTASKIKGKGGIKSSEPLKIECVRLHERAGHAVIQYTKPETQKKQKQRKLLTGDDAGADYDSDVDGSDSEDNVSETNMATSVEYLPQQLHELLAKFPDQYKHCRLYIDNSSSMYAKTLTTSGEVRPQVIKINSRLRCGRAFNHDEVVVELIRPDAEDSAALAPEERQAVQGRVIGILRRAINPKYRMFVCTVDEENSGLMIPINRSIPRMFNLEILCGQKNIKNGHVSVYTFTSEREIIFHHYEAIEPTGPGRSQSKLFIMRYLKWDEKFAGPLGIAVGVLPAGDTIEYGMKILNIEHYIPTRFREETQNEIECLYPTGGYVLPKEAYGNRLDYTNKMTFTVDDPISTDLDDAISLEELPNDCFVIGIHIADVAYFVLRDSAIDAEARKRGTSFYPMADEIPMLPARLSSDLCSLVPGKDRLAISVLITINSKADIQKCQLRRCVIRSKHRLDYEQAEGIIHGLHVEEEITRDTSTSVKSPYQDNELVSCIMTCFRIAQIWRKRRLGSASLYHQLDTDSEDTPDAHLMIEELMITANQHVALQLIQRYPQCTPLRIQLPPDELELAEWRHKFSEEARNTVAMTQPFKYRGEVCHCIDACTCIPRRDDSDTVNVDILKDIWHQIYAAVEEDDLSRIQSLVLAPYNFPQMSIAMIRLNMLQQRSEYACSGDLPLDHQTHYSLNVAMYCHFTSPIRRYIDLVVHRLVSNLIDGQPSCYSQAEITDICNQCTDTATNATRYELSTKMLHFSKLLVEQPAVLCATVDVVTDKNIQLRFPKIPMMQSGRSRLKMSFLNPAKKPILDELNEGVTLEWSRRIYDTQPSTKHSAFDKVVSLCNTVHVQRTTATEWRELVQAVVSSNRDKILDAAFNLNDLLATFEETQSLIAINDVTSEGRLINPDKDDDNNDDDHHDCRYSMTLQRSSVLQIQVGADLVNGMLSPRIQLVNLTPSVVVCLEHHADPVRCFTCASSPAGSVTSLQAVKKTYRNLESYRDLWQPVLAMEAAHNAIQEDMSFIVRHVGIRWTPSDSGQIIGEFSLSVLFCQQRMIKLRVTDRSSRNVIDDDDDLSDEDNLVVEEDDDGEIEGDRIFDYVCVRYTDVTVSAPSTQLRHIEKVIETQQPVTWVAHCGVVAVRLEDKQKRYVVRLKILQRSFEIPAQLLVDYSSKPHATIEWIDKTVPLRRMENALYSLKYASPLAQDIALGQQPKSLTEEDDDYLKETSMWKSHDVSGLFPPNHDQQEAINKSLTQPFTLIQGPPGTGKTVMGVRLVYLFSQLNRKLAGSEDYVSRNISPQVLCCGPSHKSVDVIAKYLLAMKSSCPRLVRIYSSSTERIDYPGSIGSLMMKRKKQDIGSDPELKDITLHHIVHNEGSNASYIRQIDELIRTKEQVDGATLRQYRKFILEAKMDVLKSAEVILCTCSSSNTSLIAENTNILQVVIDECGMCTELESLIPITGMTSAKQVVLIGDHQQLQPIILERMAKRRGLDKSLFERYADKAVLLTTQYRMHVGIAEFPSTHFYAGRLVIGRYEQNKPSALKFWPNGRDKPIAFVHIVGCEESLPVSTEQGSEQSKSNDKEVDVAVRAANLLVRRFHVDPQDVAVLSQYRAQCFNIETELLKRGEKDITVSTVVAAQGSEWDYVILSTVRSLPKSEIEQKPTRGWRNRHLGFIADNHQINVALTRAKKGLIIIGNKHLLQCDDMWKKLLKHYEKEKKIIDASDFMM